MGTVTITTEEWDQVRDARKHFEQEAIDLRARVRELEATGVGAGDERSAALAEAFEHALRCTRFAVENLDPETVRGWPHGELRSLGQHLETDPASDQMRVELGLALKQFAGIAREVESMRAQGREKELERVPRLGGAGRDAHAPDVRTAAITGTAPSTRSPDAIQTNYSSVVPEPDPRNDRR